MARKKILIVNSYYYPTVIGGAEISTKLLAEDMKDYFEVYVLTCGKQRSGIIVESINEVKVWRIPNLNIYWAGKANKKRSIVFKVIWHFINMGNPFQYLLLRRVIKKINPDLIHTQNLMAIGTYLWGIASKLSIPVVHTLRDYALLEPVNSHTLNHVFLKVNKKRSRSVNQIVGISRFILNQHVKYGFFGGANQHIVYNIVHPINSSKKEKSILEKGSLSIGYFGQLEKNKGIQTLINVINKLDEQIVKRVVICGQGRLESEVRKICSVDNRIKYLSKVSSERVQKLMAECDLTIVPSVWSEPFGRVIIESYSNGTPVIASNIGGIPEIIVDEKFLFNVSNVQDFAEKIKWYYSLNIENKMYWRYRCLQYSNKFKQNKANYLKIYNQI